MLIVHNYFSMLGIHMGRANGLHRFSSTSVIPNGELHSTKHFCQDHRRDAQGANWLVLVFHANDGFFHLY